MLDYMRQIQWTMKALRQLRKIKNKRQQARIYDAVDGLKDFPNCPNVKKLKNRSEYRLRIGSWRVLFTETLEIISIEEVRKRNERTYSG